MPKNRSQFPKNGIDRVRPTYDFANERNRANRSGLDLIDSYRELSYTAGRQFRDFVSNGFKSKNLFYRVFTVLFVLSWIAIVIWGFVSLVHFVLSPPVYRQQVVYPTIEVPLNSQPGEQPVYFKIKIINARATNQTSHEISFTVEYSYDGLPPSQLYIGACLTASQVLGSDLDLVKNGLCAQSGVPSAKRGLVSMTIRPSLSHPQSFDNLLVWVGNPPYSYQEKGQEFPLAYDWSP